jgi:cellulose synthase/poly-beta-1,6-N-acetylglucosamine synthase-like glycosyltransferase
MPNIFYISATLIFIIYNILDIYVTILCIYYLIMSAIGITYRHSIYGKKVTDLNQSTYKKFVLIICAHNEKYVIQNTLEEMKKLNYPKDKLDILVICDNCTDDTYEIAKKTTRDDSNIYIVERKDDIQKGKPYAVKFAFNWIDSNLEYDAISIADADNIYDQNFFLFMNDKILSGSKIIQGYLGVKNPFDNFVTSSITYAYYVSTRAFFLARVKLNMPTTLGGTGFVVEKNILKEIGWDMTSLVEDFEFSCKCVINGYQIDYCYEAKTFDEKPLSVRTSVKQRTRWMQGHFWVARNYTIKLIKAFWKKNTSKLGLFDYLAYMWSPTLYITYIFMLIAPFALVSLGFEPGLLLNYFYIGVVIKAVLYFLQKIIDFVSVLQEGYGIKNLWKSIYFYIFHTFDWVIATSRGILMHNEQGKWDKTLHVRIAKSEDFSENKN